MSEQHNFYELLGLPQDATQGEIRQVYREYARKLHPDTREKSGQTEIFLQVQEAYEVLSDPKKREIYDQKLEKISATLPVSIKITHSRPHLAFIDEPQLIYSLLELAPQNVTNTKNPPINACLIIDRSTSMQGERMDTVKAAAIELSRSLKSKDILSVITFSDRADVVIQASQSRNQKMVENQLWMIRPSGGTEIFQGLDAGFSEIRRNMHKSPINHIFLITDGRTYGDEDACLNLADQAAKDGVRITGLGIGHEWNDDFLDELAARTGGSSFYLANNEDIKTYLEEKFKTLGQLYAEQVQLNLESLQDVSLPAAYRLQPDPSALITEIPLRLGGIPKSSPLSILLEFIVPPLEEKKTRFYITSGEISLSIPSKSRAPFTFPIKLSRLTEDLTNIEMPPKPIFQALSQITLYRMQERAREEVAEGKVEEASLRLQRLATQLYSLGESALAETALIEAERIQKTNSLSTGGRKDMKYGTRSLLLPSPAGVMQ